MADKLKDFVFWSIMGHRDGQMTIEFQGQSISLLTERTVFGSKASDTLVMRITDLVILNNWDLRLISEILDEATYKLVEDEYQKKCLTSVENLNIYLRKANASKGMEEEFKFIVPAEVLDPSTDPAKIDKIFNDFITFYETQTNRYISALEPLIKREEQIADCMARIKAVKLSTPERTKTLAAERSKATAEEILKEIAAHKKA